MKSAKDQALSLQRSEQDKEGEAFRRGVYLGVNDPRKT